MINEEVIETKVEEEAVVEKERLISIELPDGWIKKIRITDISLPTTDNISVDQFIRFVDYLQKVKAEFEYMFSNVKIKKLSKAPRGTAYKKIIDCWSEIDRLYKSGKSFSQISKIVNISVDKIYAYRSQLAKKLKNEK